MRTTIIVAITSLITWFACHQVYIIQNSVEKVFFQSGVLYPLIKANESVNSDLKAGREDAAKKKIEAIGEALEGLSIHFESFESMRIGKLTEQLNEIDQSYQTKKTALQLRN